MIALLTSWLLLAALGAFLVVRRISHASRRVGAGLHLRRDPEANLSRVFDAGWRGTPSRSGDDGGVGLGLAIARGVIESHGGGISVRNVEGGCRFEVALPVPQAASHLSVS